MKYFDLDLLFGEFSINKDIKHLIKRLRGCLINEGVSMILINRQFLLKMLADKQVKADTLINPKDKQNVTAAVNLIKLINQLTENNNVILTTIFIKSIN